MQEFIRQVDDSNSKDGEFQQGEEGIVSLKEINECPSDQGMIDYLNLNKAAFHVFDVKKDWSVCSDLHYTKTPSGSLDQYK